MMNNAQFFGDIQMLQDYDVTHEMKSIWFSVLAEELLTDIRDRGGVYHLQAKKLLELLEA